MKEIRELKKHKRKDKTMMKPMERNELRTKSQLDYALETHTHT